MGFILAVTNLRPVHIAVDRNRRNRQEKKKQLIISVQFLNLFILFLRELFNCTNAKRELFFTFIYFSASLIFLLFFFLCTKKKHLI